MRILNFSKTILPNFNKKNKLKIIKFLNIIIVISIFALISSSLSLIFERKIDFLEKEITLLEINNKIFTNQLERTTKNIKTSENFILNENERNSFLNIINVISSDKIRLTNPRELYFDYYFLLKEIVEKNNTEIFRITNDAMLIAGNLNDIIFVEKAISEAKIIVSKSDLVISEKNLYEAENTPGDDAEKVDYDNYYKKFKSFNDSYESLLKDQLNYFFKYSYSYFSKKNSSYKDKLKNNLKEIERLSEIETRVIFIAFIIQITIFIILQSFEFSFEVRRGKK